MSTEATLVEAEEVWPRFEDKDNLHPSSKKSIQNMGLTTMTEIQAKTFDAAATGKDVLARARTGTGKTMAFLLPALERILENPVEGQINMLILSPTRELAAQIGEQSRQLISTHRGISYQVIFGGASRRMDISRFEQRIPTILVATPGRIQDHLDNTYVRDRRFSTLFHKTQILVLDEMDRLLDMGFRKDVEKILTFMPLNRQTLLFSATLPTEVKRIIQQSMKKDFLEVDCIHDADPTTHTNKLVQQSRVTIPSDKLVRGTVGILLNLLQDPSAKLVVFFPATKMVKFYADLFNHGLGRTVMEVRPLCRSNYHAIMSFLYYMTYTHSLSLFLCA
jgi:ATP-dependent RNA helicase MSS116